MNHIISVSWNGQKLVLCHKASKQPVRKGELVKDSRGDEEQVESGFAPHKPGSQGKVYTSRSYYYPSVFNLVWLPLEEIEA